MRRATSAPTWSSPCDNRASHGFARYASSKSANNFAFTRGSLSTTAFAQSKYSICRWIFRSAGELAAISGRLQILSASFGRAFAAHVPRVLDLKSLALLLRQPFVVGHFDDKLPRRNRNPPPTRPASSPCPPSCREAPPRRGTWVVMHRRCPALHDRDGMIDVRIGVQVLAPLLPVLLRREFDSTEYATDIIGLLHAPSVAGLRPPPVLTF